MYVCMYVCVYIYIYIYIYTKDSGKSVRIANFLCAGNYTVSGDKQACAKLVEIAKPEFKAYIYIYIYRERDTYRYVYIYIYIYTYI